ncbi:MAG: carboxypeptidase-like regulatory domain-containing protein [Gemmatimonadota bacterium]|nr:carboxypeptidase-like regulatory domain-containing protein [Gemmatimonadota bacterium]
MGSFAHRKWSALRIISVLALAGCEAQLRTLGPEFPPDDTGSPVAAAFLARVDLRQGKVTITGPGSAIAAAGITGAGPAFSLVGGDVVLLTTSNFATSPVGAFTPGKVRVTFDIAVTNRLNSVDIAGPTLFPLPPPGTTGMLLFPYDIAVATTSGGSSTGGSGNDVIVVLPSFGLVAPSPDWDGAPFNFFNDSSCTGGNDCYRWEEFAAPLVAGSSSLSRRVGFDIDPTVGQFTARLLVAADIVNQSLPTGSITGSVFSPSIGVLAGVTVTAASGAVTTTDALGAFTLTGLAAGTDTLRLTGLPTICTTPGPVPIIVLSGGLTSTALSVACTPPVLVGTVLGTITASTGAATSGIAVTVTPTGFGPALSVTSGSGGSFSVAGVNVSDGTGTVALAGLPVGCADAGSMPYSGLSSGGSVTVSITLACAAAGSSYAHLNTFVDLGSTVTLTATLDMSTFNNPLVNGGAADDIQAIQGVVSYDPLRLQFVGCANVAGSGLTNGTFNGSVAGQVQFLNFSTTPSPQLGLQGLYSCTFADIGAGAVTSATTLTVAASLNGDNLLPNISVTEASLP